MMTIAQIMEKMIAFSEGNIHDITHLSCVWTYAKTIGELEGLNADTQFILEVFLYFIVMIFNVIMRIRITIYNSQLQSQT